MYSAMKMFILVKTANKDALFQGIPNSNVIFTRKITVY